jgi:pimeloyl-ACP methyl ester carboxylesterase
VKVAERMIEANGVELCTESFGCPADPPILLIMGIGGSMLWWEEGFCRLLAEGGHFVIRYDHRDTGRSVISEPGGPEYTGADQVVGQVAQRPRHRRMRRDLLQSSLRATRAR